MHKVQAFDWEGIEPEFQALLETSLTEADVPSWLGRWSDLEKRVREGFVVAKRVKDTDANDKEAEATYLHFVREVRPKAQALTQQLKTKLLAVPGLEPRPEYAEILRRFRNEAEIYREANPPLEAEVAALAAEQGKLEVALAESSITVRGQTMTVRDSVRLAKDPDRAVREEWFRRGRERRLELTRPVEDLVLKAVELRRRIARNAGFASYRDYRWRELNRLDYTPIDAFEFHRSVEAEVVPLASHIFGKRCESLGVGSIRPWDLFVSDSQEPVRSFDTPTALGEAMEGVFGRIHPEFRERFARMRSEGRYDIEKTPGKLANFAYCSHYPTTGKAYVLWSFGGLGIDDAAVTLHEVGHAFHHERTCEAQNLVWNRPVPIESGPPLNMDMNELASQAMEFLGYLQLHPNQGGFYSLEDWRRFMREMLESQLEVFIRICAADAFEHWLYGGAPKELAPEDLDAKWLELSERFLPYADWRGLENWRAKGWWMRPLRTPFYTIDYLISLLGAYQIWQFALENPAQAVTHYKNALSLGYSKPLPELYRAAGIPFAFDCDTVRRTMQFVAEQHAALIG